MRPHAPDDVDPFAPGFLAAPWHDYRRLHAAGPVLWHERIGMWMVAGHAAARALLQEGSFLAVTRAADIRRVGERCGRGFHHLAAVMDVVPFFNDPPRHPPMRRFVSAVFAAQPLAAYGAALRALATRLLETARAAGSFDAARDFGDRLPPLFMCGLLGIPERDLDALLASTTGIIGVINRASRLRDYEDWDRRSAQALALMVDIVRERRRQPAADGISRMIAATLDGRTLDDKEIARFAVMMFLVGVETTSTLISASIRTLLDHPAEYEALRREPREARQLVEEVLRCETPVQIVGRTATRPWAAAGQRFHAGERVVVMLGAANRDPSAYPEPDRLDIRRQGPPHLAFADGPHFCVGASLARLETQIALEAFLALPPCRLASTEERWWPYDWLRRLRELPVELC